MKAVKPRSEHRKAITYLIKVFNIPCIFNVRENKAWEIGKAGSIAHMYFFLINLSWLTRFILYVWQKFRSKKRRDHRKNFYERRAYKSVDYRSLS